jgi:two-component system, chemotaxis family, sensor kinase CheA
MQPASSDPIQGLLEDFAREASVLKPGSDEGQLPLLDVLDRLRTSDQGKGVASIEEAYQRVMGLVESGTPFRAEDCQYFREAASRLAKGLPLQTRKPAGAASVPAVPKAAPQPADALQEEGIQLDLARDRDLLQQFVHESLEHLANIEQGLLDLEQSPDSKPTLNSIFRSFHTLKGGSGFLNLAPFHHLAHELETLLDLGRNQRMPIDKEFVDLILEGKDVLQLWITEMELQLNGVKAATLIQVPTRQLIELIRRVTEGAAPVNGLEADASNSGEPFPENTTPGNSPQHASDAPAGVKNPDAYIVKVPIEKLDGLMDLVGELVISQSLITRNPLIEEMQDQQLRNHFSRLFRITKELQKTTMSIRMVPVRSLFQKMGRVVRTISARVGKSVELRVEGDDTELDRTLIEELGDPLMHMVSNAIDHGIETAQVRKAAGKPECGSLLLKATHQGASVIIEIQDDGAGLNRDRIRAKALERKLIRESDLLTDKQVFNLIFEPGFSTAEAVTDISGRGVGMDVVRQNIERLRGKIDIQSTPGHGSLFTLSLPLTLAIIEGLVIGVRHQRLIIPTQSVIESFSIVPGQISTVQGRGELVNFRGRLIPILRMDEFLGLANGAPAGGVLLGVVVRAHGEERCLVVDQLVGKHEVVIKPLGDLFKSSLFVGAAIISNGLIGLILDVHALVQLKPRILEKAA